MMSMFVLHSQAPPGFPSENPFLLQVDTNQLSFLSYNHLLRSTKDEVTKKVSWYYVEKPDFFLYISHICRKLKGIMRENTELHHSS